jgi:hypothetical protein
MAYLTAQKDFEEEAYVTKQTVADLWEDYQVAQVTRDFALNKIVISEELLTIKKRERQLDQADAAAVTAAENAVNDDTQTLIDDETALTESALDLLESTGALSLASLQDQVSTPVESSEAPSTESASTEVVSTEAATETESEDEGPPPEAAPVEDVVITNYTHEEEMNLATEAEEARLALLNIISESVEATLSASEEITSTECPSNVYIGQQQADGSWKTVCKEGSESQGTTETIEPITNYTEDEEAQLAAEAAEARKLLLTAALNAAQDEGASSGCSSNTYIGQQQADGSWKTVCKE